MSNQNEVPVAVREALVALLDPDPCVVAHFRKGT